MSAIAPWERVPVDDPLDRLAELSRSDGGRLFHPLDAGEYVISIQASGAHSSLPAAPVAPADVVAWEVAIFDAGGRLLNEIVDPELATLPPEWLRYWRDGIGRFVPSPLVRVLFDRLSFGPEYFDRFVLGRSEPD